MNEIKVGGIAYVYVSHSEWWGIGGCGVEKGRIEPVVMTAIDEWYVFSDEGKHKRSDGVFATMPEADAYLEEREKERLEIEAIELAEYEAAKTKSIATAIAIKGYLPGKNDPWWKRASK